MSILTRTIECQHTFSKSTCCYRLPAVKIAKSLQIHTTPYRTTVLYKTVPSMEPGTQRTWIGSCSRHSLLVTGTIITTNILLDNMKWICCCCYYHATVKLHSDIIS